MRTCIGHSTRLQPARPPTPSLSPSIPATPWHMTTSTSNAGAATLCLWAWHEAWTPATTLLQGRPATQAPRRYAPRVRASASNHCTRTRGTTATQVAASFRTSSAHALGRQALSTQSPIYCRRSEGDDDPGGQQQRTRMTDRRRA